MIGNITTIAIGVALATSAAQAENWYFGFGYEYDNIASSDAQRATSYPFGGNIRAGWEYRSFLVFEGRFRIGFGEDGAIHSKVISPSFGVLVTEPKYVSKWLYVTAGVTYIQIESNREVSSTDPNNTTARNFAPQPTLAQTTWFVGGGVRDSDSGFFVPRVEVGYRGSDIGGLYAGAGLDIRIP